MSHEIADRIVSGIDNGFVSEKYFEDQTLFINIYYCWYFHKHLSPYCSWRNRFIKTLTKNMKRMWSKNLPNFPFFEKEMRRRKTEFDPFDYYYQSEDYFTKLMFLKPISDILFPAQKKKKKEKIYKRYVLIR